MGELLHILNNYIQNYTIYLSLHYIILIMLRDKTIYFTGKILNRKELPDDNAKTFAFTTEERASLKLKGLPIRLEHEDKLEVGTIQANWNGEDGNHWVMGSIDKDSIPATFAKHSLQRYGPDGTDKPYYTGLSLSHVHREYPDGRTEKKGIEVSLCTDPRRPNCNIIWTSKNETKNTPYKLVQEQATTRNQTNNMSQIVQENQEKTETPMETETATDSTAPTGAELSEEVFQQFSTLMEKEKAQQAKIEELEKQLAQHNETLESEKKKKQEDDAAKGRALMSTFMEHVKELVGEQEDLQAEVEPLIAQNPNAMHKMMEVVSKASKKYQENNLALQKAQAELKDKQLELKFQQLIQSKTQLTPAQVVTESASSRKRTAHAQNVTQKAVAKAVNPYAFKKSAARQPQRRRAGGMNEMLLKMYNQNKGNGLRAMSKLHEGLNNRKSLY